MTREANGMPPRAASKLKHITGARPLALDQVMNIVRLAAIVLVTVKQVVIGRIGIEDTAGFVSHGEPP